MRTWINVRVFTEPERNNSKPSPDVLDTNEHQVQQNRLGVFVLVAAIWTWEAFSVINKGSRSAGIQAKRMNYLRSRCSTAQPILDLAAKQYQGSCQNNEVRTSSRGQ